MSIKTSVLGVVAVTTVLTASSAMAQDVCRGRVRCITVEDAESGTVPITVHVEGGGVAVDFSPIGANIRKIRLDDPSRITVDHCLVTKTCDNLPSPVIYLTRNKTIPFTDIPRATVTQLLVEAIAPDGEYQSFIFPVSLGDGRAAVGKLLVGGEESKSQPKTILAGNGVSTTQAIALGVQSAQNKSLLVDPKLKFRIAQYYGYVQQGMSPRKAAKKAKISKELATRLEDMGATRIAELREESNLAQQQTEDAVEEKIAKAETQPKAIVSEEPKKVVALPPPPEVKEKEPKTVKAKLTEPEPEVAALPEAKPEPDKEVKPTSEGEIEPASEPVAAAIPAPKVEESKSEPSPHDYANALQRGLNNARINKQISYYERKWFLAQNAIRVFRRGGTLDRAAQKSGLPKAELLKLLSSGGLSL